MPRISAFYGIVVVMFHNDHEPPHFHARYAERRMSVLIATGEPLAGQLPPRAMRLVREWTELHRQELVDNWALARDDRPLRRIDPLP